jgi:lysine 2,3-aminomutase
MTETWQLELREALTSVKELEGRGFAFYEERKGELERVESRYRTLVPEYYLGLIDPRDANDPIARMAFPSGEEAEEPRAGRRDPIGDLAKRAAPRLTHRYRDRALLHLTNLCPMFCRFCFRKNLMNEREEDLYGGDFLPAMEYLARHPEIEEVICTGGDPWMLADSRLAALVDLLAERAPAVKRLRFHSRMPVTLPSRITEGLVRAISRPGRFQTVVVAHFNHPRELSAAARAGLHRLGGMLLLNQSVLLKGVNDDPGILRELFLALGNERVLPYYLHHCDLVAGAEHFRLSIEGGRAIWSALRGTMPGYFIPEYVLDTPGGGGKIPLGGSFVRPEGAGAYRLSSSNETYFDPISI